MIIMASLDMIGVASILPFIAVLTNPSLIETNFILSKLFQNLSIYGVETDSQFLFILGVFVFFLLILSLTFKAFTIFIQIKFVQMLEYSLGKRLVDGYLNQPYSWFLSHHSADLGKTILSEVQQLIAKGMGALMELISKTMIAIAIIILLFIVDPKLAITIGSFIIGVYGLIFYSIRIYLNKIGKTRLTNNKLRFTILNEAFNAIKEIKVLGIENVYIKLFSKSAKIFCKNPS